ncbi:MAG: thiamine diphosphokinase [Desulfobacterales bacterium]|jgi:thiamine pyrophosphokinase
MRAVIFANGVLKLWPRHFSLELRKDLIIAADGGSRLCRQWKVTPQVVIGDLDSIDPSELEHLERRGVEILRHPARKDHTDLELALRLACRRKAREIVILGALGERWDMTLANVLLLSADFLAEVPVKLLDGGDTLELLKGGQTLDIIGEPGDGLSLIPLTAAASGVTLQGLDYPLTRATLELGATQGISNRFKRSPARISLASGLLLVIHARR